MKKKPDNEHKRNSGLIIVQDFFLTRTQDKETERKNKRSNIQRKKNDDDE